MNDVAPHAAGQVATQDATVAAVHCKNCNAVLLGHYCVNCGQASEVHVPTTRELVHELLEGLTHSDSRLWRTLKYLWFNPGKLTLEFVAGRRVAYLPPFRLYLIVSVVFFLIVSLTHTQAQVITFDDAGTPKVSRVSSCDDIKDLSWKAYPGLNDRVKHACQEIVRDNGDNFLHVAVNTMPKAMFLFLPVIAFLHMLMYWRPRHRYAEQLLFFVHLHAFYFSVAIAWILAIDAARSWPAITGISGVLQTLLGWTLPLYTVLALRRVFRRGWVSTIFKAIALFFVYAVVFGITMAAVFVYAMMQL